MELLFVDCWEAMTMVPAHKVLLYFQIREMLLLQQALQYKQQTQPPPPLHQLHRKADQHQT
jgi:hypothetical protein